jgi:hypothetical protein
VEENDLLPTPNYQGKRKSNRILYQSKEWERNRRKFIDVER